MATEYDARILRLRFPEQDALKNQAERCSADPVMLGSIGRAVGQQVRIKRKDDPRFVALYTVKEANPPDDLTDSSRANVVRTGQLGRERLDPGTPSPESETTPDEIEATVQATVVDPAPLPAGVRFFEEARHNGNRRYVVVIAPHGGDIEEHTDEQAEWVFEHLHVAGFPARLWLCKGLGDGAKGAFDRWHITSTDIHPACFPLLQPLMARRFCYGVAFHGFERKYDETDIYIGGRAPRSLKGEVEKALNGLSLPIKVKISTYADDPKFQGFSPDNLINRLAVRGLHLEQSAEARAYNRQIAGAIAKVFASRWRSLVCVLVSLLRQSLGESRT